MVFLMAAWAQTGIPQSSVWRPHLLHCTFSPGFFIQFHNFKGYIHVSVNSRLVHFTPKISSEFQVFETICLFDILSNMSPDTSNLNLIFPFFVILSFYFNFTSLTYSVILISGAQNSDSTLPDITLCSAQVQFLSPITYSPIPPRRNH